MISNAAEAIDYIHSLSRFGKKSGLSNISLMLERLENPHKGMQFVHIAGTNGKGSVSNMIKNILINHGYKVGYYTSPYIEFFSERICIGNDMISDDDLVLYTNRVIEASKDITPIEFEFITAMAFLYFKEKACDIVVLEVGLGGRLDSTNVIDTPLLNVITPIGYDHTQILGETLSDIAFEKAGTIKENSTVVISAQMNDECKNVIAKKCEEVSATLISSSSSPENVSYSPSGTSFDYRGKRYLLSLSGTYQVDNAVTAIEAARALMPKLNLDQEDIVKGLSSSFWKCRFELRGSSPITVLDGAHNSHGIKALMQSTDTYFPNQKKVFLFSMLGEKDWKESIDLILHRCDSIILTKVPSTRPTQTEEMLNHIKNKGIACTYIESYTDAYQKAKSMAGTDGVVVVFGSLYLSGALRQYVE